MDTLVLYSRIKLTEFTQVPDGNDDMEMWETIQPETGEETMQPETEKYLQHLFGNIHSISNVIIKRNKNTYYFNVHHFKEYLWKEDEL